MSCIRDIVTIVGGGGIDCVGATLWKLVSDYRSGEDEDHVYSDVPRMPSNHLFQPRAEEIRELEEKKDQPRQSGCYCVPHRRSCQW